MSMKRVSATILAIAMAGLTIANPTPAAGQGAAQNGPVLGTWEFSGKDNNKGSAWSGTLKIVKLDPTRYEAKYYALCHLEVRSSHADEGTKEVEEPCEWNASTRTVKFGDTYPAVNVYSAVVSADGRTMTAGKWAESNVVRGKVGPVVRSGQWSAKLLEK